MISNTSKVDRAVEDYSVYELAIGFLRYEALRKLKPIEFSLLHSRNIKGERFDDMVDVMVAKD